MAVVTSVSEGHENSLLKPLLQLRGEESIKLLSQVFPITSPFCPAIVS